MDNFKIEKAREVYDSREVFLDSRRCILSTFGLNLSLIEQVILKRYVESSLDSLDNVLELCDVHPSFSSEYVLNSFEPCCETVTNFMIDYYGLPFELAKVHTSVPLSAQLYSKNTQEFIEYLNILQDKMHLL
jgi:hypothetical protein